MCCPPTAATGYSAPFLRHLTELARVDSRICGIRLYVDRSNERAQEVYARLGMHRSNYGVMETVYRGPESHEEAKSC